MPYRLLSNNRLRLLGMVIPIGLSFTWIATPGDVQVLEVSAIQTGFSDSGVAKLSAVLANGDSVNVSIRRNQYSPESFPYVTTFPRVVWEGWGARWNPPESVVTSLDVIVGGKHVWVSLSAFGDLGNPQLVILEDTSLKHVLSGRDVIHVSLTTFRLILHGGDASTGYTAVLAFNSSFLEQRTVWHGEDGYREVTLYTRPQISVSRCTGN